MIKIRLMRIGKKHAGSYRIVVIDSKNKRDSGNYIEDIGYYNPIQSDKYLSINLYKANEYIKIGAVPTKRVSKLMSICIQNDKYNRSSDINIL